MVCDVLKGRKKRKKGKLPTGSLPTTYIPYLPQSLRAASACGTPKPLRVRALCLLRKLRVASLSVESYNFTRNTLVRLPK